jgi:uncharacterized membrane protein YebE (DUF533 family)
MFDAKSILENMMRGAAPSQTPQQSGGTIGDLLNDFLKKNGTAQTGTQDSGGGLGEILSEIGRNLSQPSQTAGSGTQGSGADIGDILAQLKDKLGGAAGSVTNGGSIADILSDVLSQATQGVNEGATRIGEASGANEAVRGATADAGADELLAKLRDFIQNSPFAAGTAAGGLGGLVLGTRTGRSMATSAVKIGALAMLGGLAYKALQNYQAGKPLITGATTAEPAPAGSGFEPAAVTNDAAVHYIQAMIAAAAADGRIDTAEHDRIVGSLKQTGLDGQAEAFFAKELNSPSSVQELASGVTSPQEAIQIYTAARVAASNDSPAEQQFLRSLAAALRIDPKLAAHVDATAESLAA